MDITKYKKLNMTKHKTDMNITKYKTICDRTQNRHEHYWKTEQHFYCGMQNWHEHAWKPEQHFYDGILNRTQLHFGETNNRLTRIFESCFDKVEWFYDRYKGVTNKLYTCLPFLENFMRIFVSCFDKIEWFFSGRNFLYVIQYNSYQFVTFCHLNFHFCVFISLICNFYSLFSLVCLIFFISLCLFLH